MEYINSVGLYLARDRATAVWLSEHNHGTVTSALEMTLDENDTAQTVALAAARRIVRHAGPVEQVFVAMDCGYYTQYGLQSEFSDVRQIESTIKFDAEEAAATDAMQLAVTFVINGPLQTGTDVMVFNADRQAATDVLMDVKEGGVDPVMMEPDAVTLARALERTLHISRHPDTLYVLADTKNCYLVQPGKPDYWPRLRTLFLGPLKTRTAALTREILLTMSGWDEQCPLTSIVFVQPPDGVDRQHLAERTGLDIQVESAVEQLPCEATGLEEVSSGALLIAAGAAMAGLEKGPSADFRRDFMPYQGKRKAMEASLRLVCISLTVLFVAVGVFFQLRTYRLNRYTRQLHTKLIEQYRGGMFGANPSTAEGINSRLRRTLNNVRRVQEGLGPGDEKAVPARLTFLLEAVNNAPASVDVQIQQISITERTMRVKGDTNNRRATLQLFEEIKKHPNLRFGAERMAMIGSRDEFEFTIEPGQ